MNLAARHRSLGVLDMPAQSSSVTPFTSYCRINKPARLVAVNAGAGRGRGRKSDYLDFDWDAGGSDDLVDVKMKYEDFIRQEKTAPTSLGYTNSRRRSMSSRPYDRLDPYDDFEDDYEDSFEDTQPREAEKRYMNGKHILTNTEITAPLLRLIGPQKEQLGTKRLDEAMRMASQQDMDVILINPEQAPPVARIMQWSKFKFEIEQADKSKRAKATVVETKEIRLSPKTDDNDISIKIKSAAKFLDKGNKVKLSMKFEGRQLQFKDVGKEVLLKFISDLGDSAKVEGPLNFKGATYMVMLVSGKSGSSAPASNSGKQAAAPAAESRPAVAPSEAPASIPAAAPAAAPTAPVAPVAPARPPGPPLPPAAPRPAGGIVPPPRPPSGPMSPGPPRPAMPMPGIPRAPGGMAPPPIPAGRPPPMPMQVGSRPQ